MGVNELNHHHWTLNIGENNNLNGARAHRNRMYKVTIGIWMEFNIVCSGSQKKIPIFRDRKYNSSASWIPFEFIIQNFFFSFHSGKLNNSIYWFLQWKRKIFKRNMGWRMAAAFEYRTELKETERTNGN